MKAEPALPAAQVKVDSKNGYLCLQGDLVFASVMPVLKELHKTCASLDKWVLDFTQVKRVDSSALALLIEIKKRAMEKKKQVSFIYLPQSLMSIARLSQLDHWLNDSNPGK